MSVFLFGYSGWGMLYGFDLWYLVLVIPAFIISLYAQSSVKRTFSKYSGDIARSGYTGQATARKILDQTGLFQVRIEHVSGQLTDHFDPRSNVLRLSDSTFKSSSIAAIGVAAHEAGHAIQHEEGYMPNRIRASLVPVARIGSGMGPYMAIFGIIFEMQPLTNIGILLFTGAFLFYLVTLPVEFNASSRAVRILEQQGILSIQELEGARKVLRAAAMTYVASALVAFASLMRLLLLSRGRRR